MRENTYFIGEIFCNHNNLIPNSRRDYFNENEILKTFEDEIRKFYYNILYNIYYKANAYKNALKTVNKVSEYQNELKEKEESGFIGDEKELLTQKIESARKEAADSIKKMEKLKVDLAATENDNPFKKVINSIEKEYKKEIVNIDPTGSNDEENHKKGHSRLVDQFSSLNRQERKIVDRILSIIKNTLPPNLSEELIVKIKEELK